MEDILVRLALVAVLALGVAVLRSAWTGAAAQQAFDARVRAHEAHCPYCAGRADLPDPE